MNGDRSIREGLHVLNTGDIGRVASCRSSNAAQILSAHFGLTQVPRDHHDLGAVLTEYPGDSFADPFARSSDDDGAACNRSQQRPQLLQEAIRSR